MNRKLIAQIIKYFGAFIIEFNVLKATKLCFSNHRSQINSFWDNLHRSQLLALKRLRRALWLIFWHFPRLIQLTAWTTTEQNNVAQQSSNLQKPTYGLINITFSDHGRSTYCILYIFAQYILNKLSSKLVSQQIFRKS